MFDHFVYFNPQDIWNRLSIAK